MAYVGSANTVVSNGAGTYLYVLKEALAPFSGVGGAGWTVVQSSLGSGSVQNSDVLDTPAKFGAVSAWARLREPSVPGGIGQREYILQNGTVANGTSAIIKYSRATGFNTGGSATLAPNTGPGGDGVILVGNPATSTDAVPVQAVLANASGWVAAVASDTPGPGIYGGYAWYLLGWTAGGANLLATFTEPVAPGSTSSLDQDPMWRFGTGLSAITTASSISPSNLGGGYSNVTSIQPGVSWWQAYGLTSPSYIRAGVCGIPLGIVATTALSKDVGYITAFNGSSPYDGREPMYPMLVGQPGTGTAFAASIPKGYTTGIATFSATHNLLDTFNLNTSDPKIAIALAANSLRSVAMPWLTNIIPDV